MKVFLTGATGFLGRALTLALRREGHTVAAWVRSVEKARAALGDQAELVPITPDGPDGSGDADLAAALARCDAVVNLAGEPILARWTAEKRAALRKSRVDLTERIVRALASIDPRPRVLLSGSAIGLYGDRGDERLTEASAPGSGFLPELCRDWERAALAAEPLGVRVVLLRTGIVLGLDGGALPAMLPPFRMGAGGRIASGRQWMSWIHVEDWVRAVLFALGDARARGPVNLTAPGPVTNREFTRALASVLRRPAVVPVPALALKALFGGAASLLLESQRVEPARLADLGFAFAHSTLEGALRDLLVDGRACVAPVREAPEVPSEYLHERRPRYTLVQTTELDVPTQEAFAFFAAPENLGVLTPRAMGFGITARSGPMQAGTTIDYRIRIGPVPLSWRTRFESWQEGARFVDVQARGPYRGWWHEHRFEARGSGTRMHDRVLYTPPLGPLGRIAQRLFIADRLGDIFAQRALAIRLRFGDPRAGGRTGLSA